MKLSRRHFLTSALSVPAITPLIASIQAEHRLTEIRAIWQRRLASGIPTLPLPDEAGGEAGFVRAQVMLEQVMKHIRRDPHEGVVLPTGREFELLQGIPK